MPEDLLETPSRTSTPSSQAPPWGMFARKMEDEQLDGAKGDEHQAEYRKGGNKGNLKDTRSQDRSQIAGVKKT